MKKTYTRTAKSLVANGKQFTTNIELAIDLGAELKKAPLIFIHPRLRDTFLKAYPELGRTDETISGSSLD